MRVVVVTPPQPVIDLAEAKDHLGVDHDLDDLLIDVMIDAAVGHIDGPNGWLGRAIGPQTLEARCDQFGSGSLLLPYGPVIDVESIVYRDAAGVLQTINPDRYELQGGEVCTAWDVTWPSVGVSASSGQPIRIRYVAGYEELPPAIRVALLIMVGDLYKFRESFVSSNMTAVNVPTTVSALLQPFRVFA